MKTSVIKIDDMLSVWSLDEVETRIGEVPGVESVTVNFAAESATVRYDETRIAVTEIKSSVRQLGLQSATPAEDEPAKHAPPEDAPAKNEPMPLPPHPTNMQDMNNTTKRCRTHRSPQLTIRPTRQNLHPTMPTTKAMTNTRVTLPRSFGTGSGCRWRSPFRLLSGLPRSKTCLATKLRSSQDRTGWRLCFPRSFSFMADWFSCKARGAN